ncbi:MAG TPA: D-aminoacyl-tRNA deacylase [Candidatus Ratteibacteria bacterium]|nr:D-aminoacyl-tRNA deacylase [Candidatus Ratteibacteria bacterium]
MRVVIQRVKKASLYIENSYKGSIDKGVVVLVGFKKGDSESEVKYISDKIFNLRIFEDENGKMNYPIGKINGDIMLVPQFTLYGDVKNSNRPDFSNAENFSKANTLFDIFKNEIRRTGLNLLCGEFGKEMLVEIHNDGPVTIIIDK